MAIPTTIPNNHSASLDGKCKIWDVYNERQVKRTYSGHSAAIRCVNFNEDGSRYAFRTIFAGSVCACVLRFGPSNTRRQTPDPRLLTTPLPFPNKHTRFVTGGFDRFLRVWDTETGQVIQTVTNRKVRTDLRRLRRMDARVGRINGTNT